MRSFDARRALRFVGVAFLLYLALLVPWRLATPAYTAVLAPVAHAIAHGVDDAVAVDAAGPDLRYVRLFDEARTPARDDFRTDPILFQWMRDLFGPLHRAMYTLRTQGGGAARPSVVVQLVATFRLTLELPLFLALVLALPGAPWRQRWKPAAIGLAVLAPIHAFLAATPGLWLSDAAGHLAPSAEGIRLAGPELWLQVGDRYQYVGPVLAFALFLTLLFFGLFRPPAERNRPRPPAPAPAEPAPPAAAAPPPPNPKDGSPPNPPPEA